MDNPNTGLAALQRDGIDLNDLHPAFQAALHPFVYPLRVDAKPRAVWPAGLTHLPPASVVLEGEDGFEAKEDELADEDDRCENLSLGVAAHNRAMGRL